MTERWAEPGNVSISIFPFNFQKTVFLFFVVRSINYILVSQGTNTVGLAYLFTGDSSCNPADQQLHEPGVLHPLLTQKLCEPMTVEINPAAGNMPQFIGRVTTRWNGLQTYTKQFGIRTG